MGKAKEIAELGDKITVSGGTVTVADISTSTFSGTSIHSMQDVDLTGIAHNMFLKYNLSNTRFEVVAGNTSSIDEGTNLYYTDARVASYLSSNDFDTATNIVASITDSAPGTLDTLNELAAALGDDANFSTTVTNSIATKLPLSGGTVTGNLTVTGVGGFNDYIDLNTSGNRGKIGYDNLNLYLGSTSGTGEIHFKNNIGSTDAPHSSGDTKMVIDGSGDVGIGTTAVSLHADYDRVLHIHSTLGSLIKLTDATSGSATTDGTDLLNYGNDSFLINRDAGHLIFYTSSADRMRITSGGDVSIGSGHGGFSGWRVLNIRQLSTGGMVNFEDDDGTRAFTFASQGSGMRYQAHISGGYHRWETNATANALYITDGGNVGIGTATPSNNLAIDIAAHNTGITLSDHGDGFFPQIIYNSNRSGAGQGLGKFSSYWNGTEVARIEFAAGSDATNKDDGAILFNTKDSGSSLTTRVKIDTNGEFGIGTTDPTEKLDVRGRAYIENNGVNYARIGTSYSGHYFESQSWDNYDGFEIYQQHGSNTTRNSFVVNDNRTGSKSAAFAVRGDGNVGIGNSDPTDKLTMTVGNGGGILQSTYYSGTATSGQKLGVIGFKGYSQGNTVAGADAKIEAVAAGNHSGSSAPANLDFYTKPESIGPGSAAILRHRIHEEGHQTIYKGTNNWSVQRHSQSSGCFVCHRLYGASSSTTTYNLLRYRRHYWGSGSVKFTLSQTYYSSTSEGEYWLTGHGRSDGSYTPNYSISYVDVYNGPGTRLFTNMPGGAPGNSDAEIVDVSISIPAYYYYMVRVEVSHSEYYTTTSTMGSVNSFALFT